MAKDDMSKQDWQRKDMLGARQSALKAASLAFEGQSKDADFLIQEADKLYSWVAQDQGWKNEITFAKGKQSDDLRSSTVETVPNNMPLPTPKQSAILETFQSKHQIDKETVYKTYGRYPNTKEEAIQCLKQIKG